MHELFLRAESGGVGGIKEGYLQCIEEFSRKIFLPLFNITVNKLHIYILFFAR